MISVGSSGSLRHSVSVTWPVLPLLNFLISPSIMASGNKALLQKPCFTAGLSTEGTKKDLLVEEIIYKEAVQVPENGESSKGQYCGQEIAR